MGTSHDKGTNFEKEVQDVLRLKGYAVARNELISGTQIDLVAHREDALDNVCLIVECTDRQGPVGVDLVKEKSAVLLALAGGRHLYRLLMVARNGFTAEAKAFAEPQANVALMTLDDLENQLVDFGPYVRWYVENYEQSAGIFREGRLFEHYVELKARDDGDKLYESLTDAVTSWLGERSANLLFLLGEYGAGKTSFARQLTYRLLKDRFDSPGGHRCLPILVNLRNCRRGFDIRQLITDTLVNLYGVALPSFMAFERVSARGDIFLVLDGFDEMAESTTKQALVDCFGQIYLLAHLNVRTVVTCRTNFFKNHSDIVELFRTYSIRLAEEDEGGVPATEVTFSGTAKILFVEKLDDRQIGTYVRKRLGAEAGIALDTIRGIHDLSDLSTRPVLLDMILSTLPDLIRGGTSVTKKTVSSRTLPTGFVRRGEPPVSTY